ncbi:MAG: Ig-like domain-containing protein [Alcanivorax sp.]|nr:Ig-like domain-containing protein [Alcanivorax sp.]
MTITRWHHTSLLVFCMATMLTACGGSDPKVFNPPKPGDALIYAYPDNGLVDVPLSTHGLWVFSSPVDKQAVSRPCTGGAGEKPQGSFCVTGPDGVVDMSQHLSVINGGKTIQLDMSILKAGTRYQVWVRPSANPQAVNLSGDKPLLSFRTRQSNPIPGQAPYILAVNHDSPDAFAPDTKVKTRFPFMDFSPIRVTFSEPLDQNTMVQGQTVTLMEVDDSGNDVGEVPASMHSERHYLSLQPKQYLTPGHHYQLRLSSDIHDLDNQSLAATTLEFVPHPSHNPADSDKPYITQTLQTYPALGDPGYPRTSHLTGRPLNRFELETTALGVNMADSLPNGLKAYLGDPTVYPEATPVVAPAGQQLSLTGIDPVKLGGKVHTDLATGKITGTFIDNVTGYLTTNPFRPKGFQPDDEKAPLYVYMDFDLAMQTENPNGNATLNQNMMHVEAVGIVTIEDKKLTFEVFRTLEFDVLSGATTIGADFSLGARSDPDIPVDTVNHEAPTLTGSLPINNAEGVESNKNILLTFSEPLADVALDQFHLLDISNGGVQVPVKVRRDGTTLVVSPQQTLNSNSEYHLQIPDQLTDQHLFHPRTLAHSADDALSGGNTLVFTTADYRRTASGDMPPLVLGLYPGIGCALVDTDKTPGRAGRCAGGLSTDTLYQDFQYETSRGISIAFSQPMDTSTMRVGTITADGSACLNGAICVGHSDNGSQWQPVATSLVAANTSATLFPAPGDMPVGGGYRLVVNGDEPTFHSTAELGGLRINTTPLMSLQDPGGPNIVINFTAVAPFDTVASTIFTRPLTDTNGSGFQDDSEQERIRNSAAGAIEGVGGVITDARFADPNKNKIFLSGALPIAFLPKQPLDLGRPSLGFKQTAPNHWCGPQPDDHGNTFCIDTEGDTMIPVEANPTLVLGTSLTLQATVLGTVPLTLSTNGLLLRIRPRDDGTTYGFVVNRPGDQRPFFIVKLNAYLDAPDLQVAGGVIGHDLHSAAATAYLYGPISYHRDGRIFLSTTNLNAIVKRINVNVLSISGANAGYADLLLDVGSYNIQVVNTPSRARKIPQPLP